jgi:hypothetical protein
MKKGCLVLLLIWISVSILYFYILNETELSTQYWVPIVLGLVAGMIFANLQGIYIALKQRQVAKRHPNQWKDGDFVVVSGILSAIRSPIISPFSGRQACIVEYDVKPIGNTMGLYSGFIMTPCSILSSNGSVRLIGFPLLTEISEDTFNDVESYQRAGQYLSKCKFEEKSSNMVKFISRLNSVLTDDDGEVKVDFIDKRISQNYSDIQSDNVGHEISQQLESSLHNLTETIIANGVEVTASGTYVQSKQAINIGSGLSNLNHSLKLGNVDKSTRSMLISSTIVFIILSCIFAGSNFYLKENFKIDPLQILSKIEY